MLLTLIDQDGGQRVTARVGDLTEIHLAEIAPAGYRWAPDSYDTGLLELAEATASYPSAVLREPMELTESEVAVGSGGEAIIRFRVVGVGSSTLTLKYWRQWEGVRSIIQRFAVTPPRERASAPRERRPRTLVTSAMGVLQHRRGTPPRACIKGLISLCEFRFRRGPDRRQWGPQHDAHFRRLIRVLDQVSQGSHFGAEPHPSPSSGESTNFQFL